MAEHMLFNRSFKEMFLAQWPKSARTYERFFAKSYPMERELKKDLSKFNEEELVIYLKSLEPLTPDAAHHNGRVVSAYITFALRHNIVEQNVLSHYTTEMFEAFVEEGKEVEIYYSEKEMLKILGACTNDQDAVIIACLFSGIAGLGYSEIRYMTRYDIDEQNCMVHVSEVKEGQDEHGNTIVEEIKRVRDVKVEDWVIEYILGALHQETYLRRNGLLNDDKFGAYANLLMNKYVLRNVSTNSENDNNQVDKHTIFRRLSVISKTLNEPYLTAKNIWRSGMIRMARNLLQTERMLEKQQYEMICEQFGVKPRQWFTLKKFCNLEVIEKLYTDDPNRHFLLTK